MYITFNYTYYLHKLLQKQKKRICHRIFYFIIFKKFLKESKSEIKMFLS